jgi:hypothetical protein
VLDLERIGTCPARVLEGNPKVLHGAGMILLLKALGCPLQPQGAKSISSLLVLLRMRRVSGEHRVTAISARGSRPWA